MTHCLDDKGSKVALCCDHCFHFLPLLETSDSVDDEVFDGVTNLWICAKNRYASYSTIIRVLHFTVISVEHRPCH